MNRNRSLLFVVVTLMVAAGQLSGCAGTPVSPTAAAPAATLAPQVPPTTTAQPSPAASATAAVVKFDGQRAMQDVQAQMALGPRVPGSDAHAKAIQYVEEQAKAAGWNVELQETQVMGQPVQNIILKRGSSGPWILIGAHYDSRMKADQDKDPAKRDLPVPAANDGASGVAVLLELARTLPKDLNKQIWLVCFDSEDQGDLPGWDWTLGSKAVADSLTSKPDAVVVVDMIGDANLDIYQERNSNPDLTQQIWAQAAQAGYGKQFIPQPKYAMLDDHTPFLQRGIKAVDIIDFDYPYWHTTEDTIDKVSAQSLEAVGETLRQWLVTKP